MPLAQTTLSELRRIAGSDNVLVEKEDLIPYSFDGTAALQQMPAAVVFATSPDQVVAILKLAEEEAQAILGGGELEKLRGLGIPEIVVTFGAGGSLVLTRDAAVRVATRPARGDPTGAGDAFSVAYLSARAGGHRPISAARRASALVSALLSVAPR